VQGDVFSFTRNEKKGLSDRPVFRNYSFFSLCVREISDFPSSRSSFNFWRDFCSTLEQGGTHCPYFLKSRSGKSSSPLRKFCDGVLLNAERDPISLRRFVLNRRSHPPPLGELGTGISLLVEIFLPPFCPPRECFSPSPPRVARHFFLKNDPMQVSHPDLDRKIPQFL